MMTIMDDPLITCSPHSPVMAAEYDPLSFCATPLLCFLIASLNLCTKYLLLLLLDELFGNARRDQPFPGIDLCSGLFSMRKYIFVPFSIAQNFPKQVFS